jgi:hypothetical protein
MIFLELHEFLSKVKLNNKINSAVHILFMLYLLCTHAATDSKINWKTALPWHRRIWLKNSSAAPQSKYLSQIRRSRACRAAVLHYYTPTSSCYLESWWWYFESWKGYLERGARFLTIWILNLKIICEDLKYNRVKLYKTFIFIQQYKKYS